MSEIETKNQFTIKPNQTETNQIKSKTYYNKNRPKWWYGTEKNENKLAEEASKQANQNQWDTIWWYTF